ncbi:RND superfamily putative drug exporter [Actinomadura pelletieri DSM 43383]|uniref:RND superfamily putative drug exporter n=1 Tax=Actinomadura pelletieri DSM 43383 TaxID=1120940 RepID=A0A495QU24_9ACTN|nr:MMPL family transporter [Actinomadura pelletieri]RKS76903.1 RND superfamily putative drug exporter [Actinomadura pelletieri DSM 43383]
MPGDVPTVPLMRRLGLFAVRRRRWVLGMGLLVLVVAGVVGAGAMSALTLARFESPGSESVRADTELRQRLGTGHLNMVLLVTAKRGTVDSAETAEAGQAVARDLAAEPGVSQVSSYWSRGRSPTLRGEDLRSALAVAHVAGDATAARERLGELSPRFTREDARVKVRVGGQEEVFRQVGEQARQDFARAELLMLPVVFVLLVFAFGGPLAALLPLGVGIFATLGTLAALRGVAAFTDVSTFAANLTLVMGLGLGIDYSLFIVSRFQEELAGGARPHEAAARAVGRAGRTVLFSGLTVAVSLLGLLAFPFPFLRSFAYAGFFVVLFGVVGAVVLLPAALAVVGPRLARSRPAGRHRPAWDTGLWHGVAVRVMRRPVLVGLAVVALLVALGSPLLGLRTGFPDERVLPGSASGRQVQEEIRDGFAAEETDALRVVVPAGTGPAEIERYSGALARVPGVAQVDSPAGSFVDGRRTAAPDTARFAAGAWLSVVPTQDALEKDPFGLVGDVRAVPAPDGTVVGGYPADLADFRTALVDRVPFVIALILAVSCLLIFLMTGSVLVPLKAAALNVLSLSVMFGALVWVFQDGNLSGTLGFTATGSLEPSIPILMFCVAFGLSMDYEIFMVSRIKEEYDRTGDNARSVAVGLQRGAPLITTAAAILAVSFASYATSGVVFLKMLGIGMALAVLLDATLIRALLVPAAMRLAGRANWWAPGPLRRVHARLAVTESPAPPVPSAREPVAAD